MLLDMVAASVRVLCYKQRNPIHWLNGMFVSSYLAVQRISGGTWEPLQAVRPQPCHGGRCSTHRCRNPNLSWHRALMMATTESRKFCSYRAWRDKHFSTSFAEIWSLRVPTSLRCSLPSQHLMQKHLTGGSWIHMPASQQQGMPGEWVLVSTLWRQDSSYGKFSNTGGLTKRHLAATNMINSPCDLSTFHPSTGKFIYLQTHSYLPSSNHGASSFEGHPLYFCA